MRILDLTAGNRAVWFDKQNPLCTFLDIRPEMNPDVVADSRHLDASIGAEYDLIVFDPPHMTCGPKSVMAQRYGHFLTAEIRELVQLAGREAHRVSKPNALMAFKWNDHDTRLEVVLGLLATHWAPLFGHKVSQRLKHSSQTCWVMLLRQETQTVTGKEPPQ